MKRLYALYAIVAPGILVAATGVGAGDLITASLAGAHVGTTILWAVLVGALLKWTLTEDQPTIKAYDEKLWAELEDAKHGDIELSLALVDALHARWAAMLRTMTPEQFKRSFIHPDVAKAPSDDEDGAVVLDFNTWMYAWHGRHHVAHITGLRDRMGW